MKKGISLVSLTVVIIVMVILAGIVVVTGLGSVESANINQFALEILNIQTAVDEYHYKYNKYPVKENITVNTSDINSNSLNQFSSETIADNQIALKTLDLSLIGMNELEYGNNNEDNDIYVVSETTGKVYYLAGLEYEGIVYYTLTDDLYELSDITTNMRVNATDIKKYDAIFTVSNTNYTNEPITVDVKIPEAATFNSVTATNSKSVSESSLIDGYNVIKINQTSENKNGNYVVEVSYTYNEIQRTVTYAVTTFDNTVPTVQIYQEYSAVTNEITVNASDVESGIKQIKYELSDIENAEHFKYYGKIVEGNKIVISNYNKCTVYVQDNAGNYSVVKIDGVPDEWSTNVTAIADTVPIPKGFVASSATGENTKNGGLVIYEGDKPVTDKNVEEAKRTRNQYVWVPVDDFSKFIRQNFEETTDESLVKSNVLGAGTWEVELNTTTGMPVSLEETTDYIADSTLKFITEATISEAQSMYASVKKYRGFYIARYEAGIDTQRTSQTDESGNLIFAPKVYSVMGKIPYNFIQWGTSILDDSNGVVGVARSIYPETNKNYGVISTLTYGVQRDTVIQWYLDTNIVEDAMNTLSIGNYSNSIIGTKENLNDGAKVAVLDATTDALGNFEDKNSETLSYPKQNDTKWLLTTGALKISKANNIYDMAGNVQEWSMEGISGTVRPCNGGSFYYVGSQEGHSLAKSVKYYSYTNAKHIGFRPSLYIKN